MLCDALLRTNETLCVCEAEGMPVECVVCKVDVSGRSKECPPVCVLNDALGMIGDADEFGDDVLGCLVVSLTDVMDALDSVGATVDSVARYVNREVVSDAEGKLWVSGVTGVFITLVCVDLCCVVISDGAVCFNVCDDAVVAEISSVGVAVDIGPTDALVCVVSGFCVDVGTDPLGVGGKL